VGKESERDRSVERLLKATPRSALPGAPSPACLDASAIASWAEAALAPAEAARVEAHLADCKHCQAVLAALARAEPPAAPAAPAWRRWAVLLPMTAAAAAVALWLAWPKRQAPVALVATVAEAPPLVAEPRPQPAPVPTPPPAAVHAEPAAAPTRSARSNAAAVAGATKPVAPSSASPVFRSIAPEGARPVALGAPPPPAAPQPPPVSAQAAARTAAIGESPLTDQRLASSTGVAGGLRAPTEPIVMFESPAALGGGAGGVAAAGASGGRGGGARPTAVREVAATLRGGVTRWRILASHDLERSTDEGQTWEPVAIQPPASLTNGAAPSPLVCWLVGRAGVVLVTNDAGHFTRAAFPETLDLSAVQATDGLNATVTTANGRTFVTTDGGKTWTERRLLTPRENDLRPTKTPTRTSH
jgi:hypothetical protein